LSAIPPIALLHALPRVWVREGLAAETLIAENGARTWMVALRKLVRG
jgi:hypothetical protein